MPVIPSAVQTARNAFVAAQADVVPALNAVEQAKVALEKAKRTADPDAIEAADSNLRGATLNLIGLRTVANDARTALNGAITTWLAGRTPQADIGRLSASIPIVFFPVRLETRFDRTTPPGVLKVRIYPDDIFFETHEAELTTEEVDAATEYHTGLAEFPTISEELPRWQHITRLMSPERAAYVLRVMEPERDETSGEIISFPSPPIAPSTWNRPGEAIMPDRWVAVAYRAGQPPLVVPAVNPVQEPLTLTVDPNGDPADAVPIPGSNGQFQMDQRTAWTVDYDRAVAAGMAITIGLRSPAEAANGTGGFDRLIVFGVKTSMPPEDVGYHLEKLLDNHHYTRGFGLVRQGTPTNNTDEAPTPLPRDAASRLTLIEERGYTRFASRGGGAWVTGRGGDVEILGRFLGLADGVFPNVPVDLGEGGPGEMDLEPIGGEEQNRAAAMNRVTWPVLFGYAIQNLLGGTGINHNAGRTYFRNSVRARGPAPAFRIGMVPYGVIPALSLSRWAPLAGITDPVQNATMIDTLKRMRELWKRAAAGVARVKRTSTDPLADLLKALELYPSAREVRVREMLGPTLLYNLAQLAGIDYQVIANAVATRVATSLYSLGRSSWASALLSQIIGNQLSSRVVTDLVAPPQMLSEDAPLPLEVNYIRELFVPSIPAPPTSAVPVSVVALLAETPTFGGLERTLFYKVLRHAILREAALVAATLPGVGAEAPRLLDFEVLGVRSIQNGTTPAIVPTYSQLLTRTDFAVSAGMPLGDYARGEQGFSEMRGAIPILWDTPSAELERLFGETLDLSSHRLDAWITALATTRLSAQRSAQIGEGGPQYPFPSHFGGYAMLEDIRPTSATAPNGGFIHGPSMAHASAAAVLRSGHLTYRSEDSQKYAIDLSSERVRAARALLDAVRSGQPLGAVLGQRFERRLADKNPAANQYRYALRRYFPLVAGKEAPLGPGEAADVVAARNVVDGLAMWTAFKANQIPFATAPDLPRPNSTVPAIQKAYTDITDEIRALSEPIDGVADLVISESVYHLVRGATGTAAGQMDALARGSSPPDPEMGRSARGGIGVTERVAFLFPDGGVVDQQAWSAAWNQREVPPTPPGPTPPKTPRALAEPLLDAWAAGLLGDPKTVSCAVDLKDAAGVVTTKVVRLSDLSFDGSGGARLWPLDVLSLARADATNQGSLLERFITAAALRNEPSRELDRIVYAQQGSDRTFPQIMALALAIVELLAAARALEPGDLSVPAETQERREEVESGAQGPADAMLLRASNAHAALFAIRDELDTATAGGVGPPLEAAAAYIPFARPAPRATETQLAEAQGPILAEIDRRLAASTAVPDHTGSAASKVAAATEKLRSLFGRELLPLAGFPPPAADELQASFDTRDVLLDATDSAPIVKFLQRAGQVQAGVGRWRTVSLYLGALDRPRARLDAAQLPYTAGERWAALPFAGEAQPRGRVAFTLLSHETASPATDVPWRGFVLDEWVETVPQPTEQTGVAFHYDSPIAEAGQAILIAVPSSTAGDWSYDDILATLNETLDLAKIRAVDNERLELGHFLPTGYMARTLRGGTVSTSWPGLLRILITGAI